MRPMLWILSVGTIAVTACKGKDQASERAQPAGEQGMGGMKMDSMPMGSDRLGMGRPEMMSMMRAHMDSMMRMSPEQMSPMMAAHDRMMSQMMDRMGADMRRMNMNGDAQWAALMDSVKSDLADLPALSGKALETRMQAHVDRMRRLMERHQSMMK